PARGQTPGGAAARGATAPPRTTPPPGGASTAPPPRPPRRSRRSRPQASPPPPRSRSSGRGGRCGDSRERAPEARATRRRRSLPQPVPAAGASTRPIAWESGAHAKQEARRARPEAGRLRPEAERGALAPLGRLRGRGGSEDDDGAAQVARAHAREQVLRGGAARTARVVRGALAPVGDRAVEGLARGRTFGEPREPLVG